MGQLGSGWSITQGGNCWKKLTERSQSPFAPGGSLWGAAAIFAGVFSFSMIRHFAGLQPMMVHCMLAVAVTWNWTGTWHYIGMEEKY